MELYNAIDSLYMEDADVLDAVLSEAAVYFSGDTSLDEAASRIQKRGRCIWTSSGRKVPPYRKES